MEDVEDVEDEAKVTIKLPEPGPIGRPIVQVCVLYVGVFAPFLVSYLLYVQMYPLFISVNCCFRLIVQVSVCVHVCVFAGLFPYIYAHLYPLFLSVNCCFRRMRRRNTWYLAPFVPDTAVFVLFFFSHASPSWVYFLFFFSGGGNDGVLFVR